MENHLNISNQFVPYELAVKLKEFWFDDGCLALYQGHDKILTQAYTVNRYSNSEYVDETSVSAPLWQQVEEWILKEHKLYGIVIPTVTMHWTYKITTVTEDMVEAPPYKNVNGTDYPTYEDARKAMVKEMITMVENKQVEYYENYRG